MEDKVVVIAVLCKINEVFNCLRSKVREKLDLNITKILDRDNGNLLTLFRSCEVYILAVLYCCFSVLVAAVIFLKFIIKHLVKIP